MRRIMVLSVGVFCGCTSAGSAGTSPSQGSDVRIATGQSSRSLTIGATQDAVVANLQAPIDKVWRALPAVYESLAIPLTVGDPSNHAIGNQGMRVHSRLGNVRLVDYLDCGETAGGRNADTYDVILSVVTHLQPNSSGGTTVTTSVNASAKPASVSADYTTCTSTGGLERRLATLLEAQLQ